MARPVPPEKDAAVEKGAARHQRPNDQLVVLLAFDSVEEYRAMGADIAAVRGKLGLPRWSTPTEIIAAALQTAL
jgi:hypothetical protein